MKLFQDYVSQYPKYTENTQKYATDDEYKQYIQIINETAVRCNKNCGYSVCPWCNYCKVDHVKDNCSDGKWDIVKKHHGTWRQWFMDSSEILNKHEWAIWHSYYDPIMSTLQARRCPCNVILYNRGNEKHIIDMLKHYDSRMLTLNVTKINEISK